MEKYHQIWSEDALSLLGKFTDREVATRLGISHKAARAKRLSLGLSPCLRGFQGRPPVWTPEVLARLGNEPDLHIARATGVSAERVRQKRNERGIPVFRRKKG